MYRDQIMNMDIEDFETLIAGYDINQEVGKEDLCNFIEEREGLFDTAYDDILDSIYNGNWTEGAEIMLREHIHPNNLIDWLEEQREDIQEYYSFFGLSHAVAMAEEYRTVRDASYS